MKQTSFLFKLNEKICHSHPHKFIYKKSLSKIKRGKGSHNKNNHTKVDVSDKKRTMGKSSVEKWKRREKSFSILSHIYMILERQNEMYAIKEFTKLVNIINKCEVAQFKMKKIRNER